MVDINKISLESGNTCTVELNEEDIVVYDCYRYDLKERLEISKYIYQTFKDDYKTSDRSMQSISAEILAHKIAYDFGMKSEHAKNATIEKKDDPRWYVVISYKLLQILNF